MIVCSIYEDPDLAREMLQQEALEEAMQYEQVKSIVPAGFEGVIAKLAAQKVAQRPVKAPRPTLVSAARKALDGGEAIPLLVFESAANFTYNRHSTSLHQLWAAKDEAGLLAYVIKGTNTYAKALRAYRDVLVESVRREAVSKAKAPVEAIKAVTAKTKVAPKAKKIVAAKSTKATARKPKAAK